jgi:hypothetical protein
MGRCDPNWILENVCKCCHKYVFVLFHFILSSDTMGRRVKQIAVTVGLPSRRLIFCLENVVS